MNDDLERLLREDGERWRSSLPVAPGPEIMRAPAGGAPSPARRWVGVLATAACVLLVVGLAVGLHRGRATSSAAAHRARACEDEFTVLAAHPAAHAAGTLLIMLAYAGTQRCTISAYGPWIELRAADRTQIGAASHTTLEGLASDTVTVHTGQRVQVTVSWSPPCVATLPPVTTLVIHLSGNPVTSGDGVAAQTPADFHPACAQGLIDPSRIQGFTAVALTSR